MTFKQWGASGRDIVVFPDGSDTSKPIKIDKFSRGSILGSAQVNGALTVIGYTTATPPTAHPVHDNAGAAVGVTAALNEWTELPAALFSHDLISFKKAIAASGDESTEVVWRN